MSTILVTHFINYEWICKYTSIKSGMHPVAHHPLSHPGYMPPIMHTTISTYIIYHNMCHISYIISYKYHTVPPCLSQPVLSQSPLSQALSQPWGYTGEAILPLIEFVLNFKISDMLRGSNVSVSMFSMMDDEAVTGYIYI